MFGQLCGKCIRYEAAATRVRFQRPGDGQFCLTVAARGSGVSVTLAVGVSS